jgi:hypothetical protein
MRDADRRRRRSGKGVSFLHAPVSAAPEQFAFEGAFSPATDNWALGVMLFEGSLRPSPVLAGDAVDNRRGPRGGAARCAGIPAVVDDSAETLLQPWLRRLLEREPEQRYVNALEAHRDLQAIATELEGRLPAARAFVAMPFESSFDSVWRGIRAACAACRVSVTRVDQSHRHENIWDEICGVIRSSDFTIAVASPDSAGAANPNVMLEIGFARRTSEAVLLLTDAVDTLPFDLRTQRAMIYSAGSVCRR